MPSATPNRHCKPWWPTATSPSIYRRSPVGLPLPAILAKAGDRDENDKLNRLLQELAWDAVTHHPLSGVKAESPSPGSLGR